MTTLINQTLHNKVSEKLLKIIKEKESNLAVAIDVTTKKEFLKIARSIAPHICLLKTHIDIINDFDKSMIHELIELSKNENFLIMEDKKFADIGKTVEYQYRDGIYHIVEWADIVTVHAIAGPGTIEALSNVAKGMERAIVLIAEMSSKGTLTKDSYTHEVVKFADDYSDFVLGCVTQRYLERNFIHMTPGVHLNSDHGKFGQQYKTPQQAIENGADIIIVGNGIIQSEDIKKASQAYQKEGWHYYFLKKYH